MKTWLTLLIVMLMASLVPSSQAVGPFWKKARPEPAQRVAELLNTLKGDPDERKRAEAAEDLRDYDPRLFPHIVPALIEALDNEKTSWRVRLEAATTLGKHRPLSPEAAHVLERAAAQDESLRVRKQAKAALFWSGYRGANQADGPLPTPPQGPAFMPPTTLGQPSSDPNPRKVLITPSPGSPAVVPPKKGLFSGLFGLFRRQPAMVVPAPSITSNEPPLAEPPVGMNPGPLTYPAAPRTSKAQPRPAQSAYPGVFTSQPRTSGPVPVRIVPESPLATPGPIFSPVQPTPAPRPPAEDDGPILTPPRP